MEGAEIADAQLNYLKMIAQQNATHSQPRGYY
jgi:hypothetical protein